jgi:hypothetical protein
MGMEKGGFPMPDARDACESLVARALINEVLLVPPPRAAQLACLNFKVPLLVRQKFKVYAARHNMTVTEVLLRLLDDCLNSDTTQDPCSDDKEITI